MTEAVSGWFIVEVDDLDAGIEVAARVPAARYGGAVEIRSSEVLVAAVEQPRARNLLSGKGRRHGLTVPRPAR